MRASSVSVQDERAVSHPSTHSYVVVSTSSVVKGQVSSVSLGFTHSNLHLIWTSEQVEQDPVSCVENFKSTL